MPDTDRELLQAAAAAGMRVVGDKHPPDGLNVEYGGRVFVWRPRADDGDALRLAVELDIDIDFHGGCAVAWSNDRFEERFGSDPMAATRRAIVRAAASMAPTAGTSMADGER